MASSSAERKAPTKQEIEDVQTKLEEMKVESMSCCNQPVFAALMAEVCAVEAKCAALRAEARRMVSAIKSNYNCEMMKIPKKIRSMNLQEFMHECGGDIATVMARNRRRALESRRVGPSSSSSSRYVIRNACENCSRATVLFQANGCYRRPWGKASRVRRNCEGKQRFCSVAPTWPQ